MELNVEKAITYVRRSFSEQGALGDTGGDEGEDSEMEAGMVVPQLQKKTISKPPRVHNLPNKPTFFQVRIKIIKARHLTGNNINPCVRVSIQHQKKQTKVKKASTKPFFNENFFFNFNENPDELFDKIVTFEVHDMRKGLLGGSNIIGTFYCDLGTFYFEKDHAALKKWLLLTAPMEQDDDPDLKVQKSSGSPAGFLQINGIVLGSGDEIPGQAKFDVDVDDVEDIESNLLLPQGASLQTVSFFIKVYKAEDLPQMDSGISGFAKKIVGSDKPCERCDPYASFTFAGQTMTTSIRKETYSPEFNEELRIAFKFPSMCERLKLQLFDWDRVGSDQCIGSNFLSLSAMSGLGQADYLPSYGPSFVNFYGSIREYSMMNSDDSEDMNKGLTEGVFYRGRVLIEIATKFGNYTKIPLQELKRSELVNVQRYMKRRKYKLFTTFLGANMISPSGDAIEFEVSIGNYGSRLDDSGDPKCSSTPPVNPMFDGHGYYYLPINENKPCCVVDSHWEDIAFRLEAKNFMCNIVKNLQTDIEALELAIKTHATSAELATLVIMLLEHLIIDCSDKFPRFAKDLVGVTELDRKIQEIRIARLSVLVEEARIFREQATSVDEALGVVKGYLQRLKDLSIDPQNSLPDILITMSSGGKKVAYCRIPTYEVMFSNNPLARGKNCGQLLNLIMKHVVSSKDSFEKIPANINVIMWFGLESDQEDWIGADYLEGKYSVYAETFENQIKLPIVGWTNDGVPRPSFSDIEGDVRLNKEDFIPPKGWKWDPGPHGEWFIDAEFRSSSEKDSKDNEAEERVYENQKRLPGGKWNPAPVPHTNSDGEEVKDMDTAMLPEHWAWSTEWTLEDNRACDEEGWEYCTKPSIGDWRPIGKMFHRFRRRLFVRTRILVMDSEELKKEEKKKGDEGWGYAPVFGKKYHNKERVVDYVRRRRWHRKMIVEEHGSPPVFTVHSKEKKKSQQIMPRIFLAFDKPHKWQLRAYLYQARDIIGMDDDSTSDAYAKVCFQNQSAVTRVINQTLSPEWDETIIFEDLMLYGSPKMIAGNPPHVLIELFDEDVLQKDDFIGRCIIQPNVKIGFGGKSTPTRLLWHPIKRGNSDSGELLAAFELFLDEGLDLPYMPPIKDNRYTVPTGIRPVIIRTGVEVLLWGVRNMRKFQLASCTSPSVTVEIGSHVITSDVIKNSKKTPNFAKNFHFVEMYLPKDPLYMPPINIKVRDHRTFGRKPIVGTHVIKSIPLCDPPNENLPDSQGVSSDAPPSRDKAITIEDDVRRIMRGIRAHSTCSFSALPQANEAYGLKPLKVDKEKEVKVDNDKDKYLDWWSKYYASIGETEKCGTYLDEGHKTIEVYKDELEEIEPHDGFGDFVKTYTLDRGKQDDDEEDSTAGEFKGNFRIYPLPPDPTADTGNLRYLSKLPDSKPTECLVRVYVIRGIELKPQDASGKMDPYIICKLGKKKISTKDKYIPNTTNPYFGAFFELKAKIPIAKDLKIRVMDYDLLSSDDLVGETIIDLENRLLTKSRATVGLPKRYYIAGPYKWRDTKKPREILDAICRRKPQYVNDRQVLVEGEMIRLEEFESTIPDDLHLGPDDQRLALYILNNRDITGHKLISEHVETRSLHNPLEPNMEQGELQLFVDIFPTAHGPPGAPINITPRKPRSYELRVIIWNTADVPLTETSVTGEDMTDIYIKAWLEGCNNQKTDVHYRSLSGEGMFNWRMIFPLKYLPEESIMIVEQKEHFWSLDKTAESMPPKFTVQVWDHDMFSSNDFIGSFEVNLNKIPFPAKSAKKCNLAMLETDRLLDLFKVRTAKGWWILGGTNDKGVLEEKGKIEMTLEILTMEESEERPSGRGRDDPNANPKLEEPNRPKTSFLWIANPLKTFRYIIWKRYRCVIITLIIVVLLLIFIGLFIAGIMKFGAKKVLGA